MKSNNHIAISLLLLASGIMLSLLVPGGPIENRDFSHLNPSILLTFNVFLTVLGLGSFILIPAIWKNKKLGMKIAIGIGLSYIIVYGIDLAKWFPQSPTDMSQVLFAVEVTGILLATPLIWLSFKQLLLKEDSASESFFDKEVSTGKWIGMTAFGVVIVLFATFSAINSGV